MRWLHRRCRLVVFGVAFAAILFAAGCGSSEPKPEPAAPPVEETVRIVGVSLCGLDTPWRKQLKTDLLAASENYSDLEMRVLDAGGDNQQQRQDVEKLIGEEVDALILYPGEAQGLTAPAAEAYELGMPVIVLHRALIGDRFTSFLAADDRRIGEAVGQWLMLTLGNKGMIVELKGSSDSTRSQQRREGFREAVNYADVRVLFEVDMQWSEEAAREEMATVLQKYQEIDAVFAHNDAGAFGAYQAAKEAGRNEGVLFVGINALPDRGLKWVKQGILAATFEYPTGGREALEAAMSALAGDEPPARRITLPSRFFTAANVDQGGAPLP
jgi:ribose transport system substrate-binding protein